MTELPRWSVARSVAQPFVRAAAEEHTVFARWYEQAQETGISYRRTDMLEDWRREKGLLLHEVEMSNLRPETVPRDATLTATNWDGMSTKYMYEFRIHAEDKYTREGYDGFRVITTDQLLTVGEMTQEYQDRLDQETSDPHLDVLNVTLMAVRWNPNK